MHISLRNIVIISTKKPYSIHQRIFSHGTSGICFFNLTCLRFSCDIVKHCRVRFSNVPSSGTYLKCFLEMFQRFLPPLCSFFYGFMKDQIHVSQGIVRPRNEICGTGSGFRKIDEYSKMLMILEYCSVILYKESTLSLFVIWVD